MTVELQEEIRAYNDRAGLDELRIETLRIAAVSVIALATGYDLVLAVYPSHLPQIPMPLDLVLIATAVVTLYLLRVGTLLASFGLIGGLTLSLMLACWLHPQYPVVCTLALVVVLTATLYGSMAGLLSALAMSLVAYYLAVQLPDAAADGPLVIAFVMIWLSVGLAWLGTRPVAMALDSAWSSYVQAERSTREARKRQAELVQLNRSLDEACLRLEQANSELERARKAAVRARTLRDRFVATVSHEMRTPLNLVIGFAELLMDRHQARKTSILEPDQIQDVQAIFRNACHLSSLIDDILDLARLEADRLPLQREWTSLAQVVQEATLAAGSLVRAKNLYLDVDIPEALPSVNVDRARVRQVLINLLANASRFTSEGGVRLGAREEPDEIIVWVADSGIGIPREYLQQIFEEFGQTDQASHSGAGGTGLGLTISKRLIELHGGRLWAESEEGQGSTFYFSIPKEASGVVPRAGREWQSRIRPLLQPERPRTILTVSQDSSVVQAIRRHLDGYRLVEARHPRQVRRLVASEHPEALLFIGESQDWLQRCARLGETMGGLPTISCLMATRHGLGAELAVLDCLAKPVTRDQLRTALAQLPRHTRSCLIVDDDPQMTRLLSTMVKALHPSWEVKTAFDGASAINQMRIWTPGLVLLDLLMPEVDGYAVLRHMRQTEDLRKVPVIVVSAKGKGEDGSRTLAYEVTSPNGLEYVGLLRCLKANLDALVVSRYTDDQEQHVAPVH